MYETSYHRPASLADAAALFAEAGDGRYLAGGHTLIPTMKQRLAAPTDLIDLTRIGELKGIRRDGGALVVGAAETHAAVAASAEVAAAIPALAELAATIGDPAVRARGTLGGSVANNDPAADYPAALLALDAKVVTDRREIAAADFFTGLFSTALEPGEIILRVAFLVPAAAAYAKFRNPASRYAMAGVFVARLAGGEVRVAVTGAGSDGVFRAEALEAALARSFSAAALEGVTVDPSNLLADIHGSAAYRANLVLVMARRAVAKIAE